MLDRDDDTRASVVEELSAQDRLDRALEAGYVEDENPSGFSIPTATGGVGFSIPTATGGERRNE